MRRKAVGSDLVIVNRHLFADLNIESEAANAPDAGILPEAAAVILDEAHESEGHCLKLLRHRPSHARF